MRLVTDDKQSRNIMRPRFVRISGLAFLAIAQLLGQKNGPPISGIVIGSDGSPVSAVVTALRTGSPVDSGRTETAADGSFQMAGITDGNYELCVADKAGIYLDPCEWSASPLTVTVSAANPISGLKVVVAKGVPAEVHLNDPNGFLTPSASSTAPSAVIASIVTARHTLRLIPVASRTSSLRVHRTAVPLGASVSLTLFGKGLTITDASGNAVDISKGFVTQLAPISGGFRPLVFNVVGAHP
jgi:hypothetical protein